MPEDDAVETAFYSHVDACVDYVKAQPDASSAVEAFRVVVNALKFILFGDEQGYEFVTTPESHNSQTLADMLVWVYENVRMTDSARIRFTRLNMFVNGIECTR